MLSNHPTQRRAPSSRNLEIYALVRIRGCSQTQVAADHRITQSRVSRIVAQVEEWRGTSPDAQDQLSMIQRRRHERQLARERFEELYQRSIEELAASRRTLTIERSGSRDGKDFCETTRREQPTNVQWMKTATKAADNLVKLSELEPLSQPQSDDETPEQQLAAVSHLLTHRLAEQLRAAEERAPSPSRRPSYVLQAQARATVKQCLADLLGPPATDPLSPRVHPGASADQPPTDNCHNCHTPAAAMTPENAADSAADLAATPCAATPSAEPAATCGAAVIPSAPPKNPADMTVSREPWEDEYERTIAERRTVQMPPGAVMFGKPAGAP